MDGYVSKPIRREELSGAIAAAVGGGPQPPRGAANEPRTEGPFDETEALEHVKGDRKILQELVGIFLEEGPRLTSGIRKAIGLRDGPALTLAAHTLKGAAVVFAGHAAAEAAGRLERIGRDGEWPRAEEAWAVLQREIARLIPALSAVAGVAAPPRGESAPQPGSPSAKFATRD
jgi:HPt (histidine-containing phosphotransfer) domain-containing protein